MLQAERATDHIADLHFHPASTDIPTFLSFVHQRQNSQQGMLTCNYEACRMFRLKSRSLVSHRFYSALRFLSSSLHSLCYILCTQAQST